MGFILWRLLLFLVLHIANSFVNESSLNNSYSIYCLGLSVHLQDLTYEDQREISCL